MTKIQIPYNFIPRPYQLDFFIAMDSGYKRGYCVWSRRSGKDKTFLNFMINKMLQRIGVYFYFFPTFTQGKKILWDGIDRDGFKFLNHFPKEIILEKPNNQEMKIKLVNGSVFQIIGTDNYDAIRGSNPIGCVFSEFAYQNPMVWDVVKPILKENKGWAVFNTTPRGQNHAFDLSEMAKDNPNWYYQILTINDIKDNDDNLIITKDDIEEERREGMPEEMIQQEYYCSFEAPNFGSYYGKLIIQAEEERRICNVNYDPLLTVDTYWDIGIRDYTSIWFVQKFGKEIRLIDYFENMGEGALYYLNIIKEKKYNYGKHYFPHDIEAKSFATGKSTLQILLDAGLKNYDIVPKLPIEHGIEQVRKIFVNCFFDKEKCKQGIRCLRSYQKEFNEKKQAFKDNPLHDWASHGADAFRYLACMVEEKTLRKKKDPYKKYRPKYSKIINV